MSESQENRTKIFLNELTDYLKENKLSEALGMFENDNYDDIIKDSSWDIVPIASSYLTIENTKHNEELIDCCTSILNIVTQKCNPLETILELLEQVEGPEDDVKFCIILNMLGKSFSKMTDKAIAIEWCISTIRSYVDSLSIPEKGSQDRSVTITNILDVYGTIVSFLEPMINEAALENENSEKHDVLRSYILSALIFLMGKPLCFLEEKEMNLQQLLPEKIITLMYHICGDPLWFLNIVNKRSRKSHSKKRSKNEESHNLTVILFEFDENVPDLAYANFYFYVLTKMHLWEKVPQIYNLQYIFQICIYLIIKLLEEQDSVSIEKGLILMEHLLKRIGKKSLMSKLLELNTYSQLFDVIVKVMIYYDNDKERKRALYLFEEYIQIFDMEARYFIVLHLFQTSKCSGFLSLTTSILKSSIIECLEEVPPIPYFLGNNLESLLKLACKLPHGYASDLVEISDEVITSLNLLRYLFIRDKQNQSGAWNLVDKLETDYLKPLRKGLGLCKAYWRANLKDLEEQKETHEINDNTELEKNDVKVTLTVGGEILPPMSVQENIKFCHQAVNGLDVMESILIRVIECIADNPLKKNSNSITTSE